MSPVRSLLPLLLCAAAPDSAAQTTVLLQAVDSKSIQEENDRNFQDNRLRVYRGSQNQVVTAYVKFDLGSIPDTAEILSLKLRTYHEGGFGNPYGVPEAQLHHVDDDAWARGQIDPYLALGPAISGVHSREFPFANLTPYVWKIDAPNWEWSLDLEDDTLSIALHNPKTTYSYVYWYGSDPGTAPELEIDYLVGPQLDVSGLTAGGTATVTVTDATPDRLVGLAHSVMGIASSPVVTGACGTTTLNLAAPFSTHGSQRADASGTAVFLLPVPANATGHTVWLQALDLVSCELSDVFQGSVQ